MTNAESSIPTPNPKRDTRQLRFISHASGIGILLVVFGHSTMPNKIVAAHPPSQPYELVKHVIEFIYSFHMPLFFAISGLLFAHTTSGLSSWIPDVRFIRNKARRLLLPYFSISTLTFPMKVLMSAHALHPVTWSLESYLTTLFFPWKNTIVFFWFLITLFEIFLVAVPLKKGYDSFGAAWGLPVTAVLVAFYFLFPHGSPETATFLNWTGALHNLIFFWMGIVGYPVACAFANSKTSLVAGVFGMTMLAATYVSFLFSPNFMYMKLVAAILGTVSVFAISISAQHFSSWLSDSIENASFQIYLLSWFPQQAVILVGAKLTVIPLMALVVMSTVVGVLVPVIIARYLHQSSAKWRPVKACVGIN